MVKAKKVRTDKKTGLTKTKKVMTTKKKTVGKTTKKSLTPKQKALKAKIEKVDMAAKTKKKKEYRKALLNRYKGVKKDILNYLLKGKSLDTIDAFYYLGTFKLATRISEATADGWHFDKRKVKIGGKTYYKYSLKAPYPEMRKGYFRLNDGHKSRK